MVGDSFGLWFGVLNFASLAFAAYAGRALCQSVEDSAGTQHGASWP